MMRHIQEGHWTLDRRIPFAVILTMVMQIVAALVWATQLDARVNNVEAKITTDAGLSEKFARLDERLEGMKQNIDGMKHQLDRLTDKLVGK